MTTVFKEKPILDPEKLSQGELTELRSMGLLSSDDKIQPAPSADSQSEATRVGRRSVHAPEVLNEAFDYALPSSFSRGMRVELPGFSLVFISGTASVDEAGQTIHVGDFRAQCWRTYHNISQLLKAEGIGWEDVVKCTCYLRDIERDYKDFNEVRTTFFRWLELDPLPASVGIQARLCREDLLVEIEALAVIRTDP